MVKILDKNSAVDSAGWVRQNESSEPQIVFEIYNDSIFYYLRQYFQPFK